MLKNKDKMKRDLFNHFEMERIKLNVIRKNVKIPTAIRRLAEDRLASLPRNSSIIRTRNRSLIKDKEMGRAIFKDLGLDRISLKEEILKGNVPGYSPYTY